MGTPLRLRPVSQPSLRGDHTPIGFSARELRGKSRDPIELLAEVPSPRALEEFGVFLASAFPGSGTTAFRKHSFPGHGMKRERMELARWRCDVGEVLRRDRQKTIDEPWQTLIGWLGQARGVRPQRPGNAFQAARPSCGAAACIAHDGEPGGSDREHDAGDSPDHRREQRDRP